MLWKNGMRRHARSKKADSDSIFRGDVFHSTELSTGVDNSVENVTHAAPFVGYESACRHRIACISRHHGRISRFKKRILPKTSCFFF